MPPARAPLSSHDVDGPVASAFGHTTQAETGRDELDDHLRSVFLASALRSRIDRIRSPETVSSDVTGSVRADAVDGFEAIVTGRHGVVCVGPDNENGESHQLIRVLEGLTGTLLPA